MAHLLGSLSQFSIIYGEKKSQGLSTSNQGRHSTLGETKVYNNVSIQSSVMERKEETKGEPEVPVGR